MDLFCNTISNFHFLDVDNPCCIPAFLAQLLAYEENGYGSNINDIQKSLEENEERALNCVYSTTSIVSSWQNPDLFPYRASFNWISWRHLSFKSTPVLCSKVKFRTWERASLWNERWLASSLGNRGIWGMSLRLGVLSILRASFQFERNFRFWRFPAQNLKQVANYQENRWELAADFLMSLQKRILIFRVRP